MKKATCPTCAHDMSSFAELRCQCPTCLDYQDYLKGLLEDRELMEKRP